MTQEVIDQFYSRLSSCIDCQYVRYATRGEITADELAELYIAIDPPLILTPIGIAGFLDSISLKQLSFFVNVTDQMLALTSVNDLDIVTKSMDLIREGSARALEKSAVMSDDMRKHRSDLFRYFQSVAPSTQFQLSPFEIVLHGFFVVFHNTIVFEQKTKA